MLAGRGEKETERERDEGGFYALLLMRDRGKRERKGQRHGTDRKEWRKRVLVEIQEKFMWFVPMINSLPVHMSHFNWRV